MGSLPVPSHSSASDLDLVDPRYNLSRLSGSVIDARGMVLDRYAVSGWLWPAPVVPLSISLLRSCCSPLSRLPRYLDALWKTARHPSLYINCSKLCTIPRIFRWQDLSIPSPVLVFPYFLYYSNGILTSCNIHQAPFFVLPSSVITLLHPTPDSLLCTKERPSFVLQIPSLLVVGRNNVSMSGMCKYLYYRSLYWLYYIDVNVKSVNLLKAVEIDKWNAEQKRYGEFTINLYLMEIVLRWNLSRHSYVALNLYLTEIVLHWSYVRSRPFQ